MNQNPRPGALSASFDGGSPISDRPRSRIATKQARPWINSAARTADELGPGRMRDVAFVCAHGRRVHGAVVDGMRGWATAWRGLPCTARLGRVGSFEPASSCSTVAISGEHAVEATDGAG